MFLDQDIIVIAPCVAVILLCAAAAGIVLYIR